jgi:hypothetical protein
MPITKPLLLALPFEILMVESDLLQTMTIILMKHLPKVLLPYAT